MNPSFLPDGVTGLLFSGWVALTTVLTAGLRAGVTEYICVEFFWTDTRGLDTQIKLNKNKKVLSNIIIGCLFSNLAHMPPGDNHCLRLLLHGTFLQFPAG